MRNDPCKECGLCCKKMIVEITQMDVDCEPRLLDVAVPLQGIEDYQEYSLARGSSSTCPLLSADNDCEIYETRPRCCQQFEVGSDRCNELREDYGFSVIETTERTAKEVADFDAEGAEQ